MNMVLKKVIKKEPWSWSFKGNNNKNEREKP